MYCYTRRCYMNIINNDKMLSTHKINTLKLLSLPLIELYKSWLRLLVRFSNYQCKHIKVCKKRQVEWKIWQVNDQKNIAVHYDGPEKTIEHLWDIANLQSTKFGQPYVNTSFVLWCSKKVNFQLEKAPGININFKMVSTFTIQTQ